MTSMEKGKSVKKAGGGDQKSRKNSLYALGISQMAWMLAVLEMRPPRAPSVYTRHGLFRQRSTRLTERIGYTFAFFKRWHELLVLFPLLLSLFQRFGAHDDGNLYHGHGQLLLHNADTTDTTFTIAIGIMYGCGYPIGHTALLELREDRKEGPQGFMLGMFASVRGRIAFPSRGFLADTYSDTAIFLVMTIVLVASNVVAWIYRKEIIAIID